MSSRTAKDEDSNQTRTHRAYSKVVENRNPGSRSNTDFSESQKVGYSKTSKFQSSNCEIKSLVRNNGSSMNRDRESSNSSSSSSSSNSSSGSSSSNSSSGSSNGDGSSSSSNGGGSSSNTSHSVSSEVLPKLKLAANASSFGNEYGNDLSGHPNKNQKLDNPDPMSSVSSAGIADSRTSVAKGSCFPERIGAEALCTHSFIGWNDVLTTLKRNFRLHQYSTVINGVLLITNICAKKDFHLSCPFRKYMQRIHDKHMANMKAIKFNKKKNHVVILRSSKEDGKITLLTRILNSLESMTQATVKEVKASHAKEVDTYLRNIGVFGKSGQTFAGKTKILGKRQKKRAPSQVEQTQLKPVPEKSIGDRSSSPKLSTATAISYLVKLLEPFMCYDESGKYHAILFKFIKMYIDVNGAIGGVQIDKICLHKKMLFRRNAEQLAIFKYLIYHVETLELSKKDLLTSEDIQLLCLGKLEEKATHELEDFRHNLRNLNIDEEDEKRMWNILAATVCLHLLEFETESRHDLKSCLCQTKLNVQRTSLVCRVLGIEEEIFEQSVCCRRITVGRRSSITLVPVSPRESKRSCEALSLLIYEALFEGLVRKANSNSKQCLRDNYIGILDIPGARTFEKAGLEALLESYLQDEINLRFDNFLRREENQELQILGFHMPTKDINIQQKLIFYVDRRNGIFAKINESTTLSSILDTGIKDLQVKMAAAASIYPQNIYPQPKEDEENYFSIVHYHGKVNYCYDDFIQDNSVYLRHEPVELIIGLSQNDYLIRCLKESSTYSRIFEVEINEPNPTNTRAAKQILSDPAELCSTPLRRNRKALKAYTTCSETVYKISQIANLLDNSDLSFILQYASSLHERSKHNEIFLESKVEEELTAFGFKQAFEHSKTRYREFYPLVQKTCRKKGISSKLDSIKAVVGASDIEFQRADSICVVSCKTCKRLEGLIRLRKACAVIAIQQFFRRKLHRIKVRRNTVVIAFQSYYRAKKHRKSYLRLVKSSIRIQRFMRKVLSQIRANKRRVAALTIQSWIRAETNQQQFLSKKRATAVIIRSFAVLLERRRRRKQISQNAAVTIQGFVRSRVAMINKKKEKSACILLQSVIRAYFTKLAFKKACESNKHMEDILQKSEKVFFSCEARPLLKDRKRRKQDNTRELLVITAAPFSRIFAIEKSTNALSLEPLKIEKVKIVLEGSLLNFLYQSSLQKIFASYSLSCTPVEFLNAFHSGRSMYEIIQKHISSALGGYNSKIIIVKRDPPEFFQFHILRFGRNSDKTSETVSGDFKILLYESFLAFYKDGSPLFAFDLSEDTYVMHSKSSSSYSIRITSKHLRECNLDVEMRLEENDALSLIHNLEYIIKRMREECELQPVHDTNISTSLCSKGSYYYKKGMFEAAKISYTKALLSLQKELKYHTIESDSEVFYHIMNDLKAKLIECYIIRAQCKLELRAYESALKDTDYVLKMEKGNEKAFFIRSLANFKLGRYHDALYCAKEPFFEEISSPKCRIVYHDIMRMVIRNSITKRKWKMKAMESAYTLFEIFSDDNVRKSLGLGNLPVGIVEKDFHSVKKGFLQVSANEKVIIVDRPATNWLYCANASSVGFVPCTYVNVLEGLVL